MGRATFGTVSMDVGGMSFLSTPSVGRATGGVDDFDDTDDISIHALRGEGDIKKR